MIVTAAQSYQEAPGHDEIVIEYKPGTGLFAIGTG
jgi:hypothetical protein